MSALTTPSEDVSSLAVRPTPATSTCSTTTPKRLLKASTSSLTSTVYWLQLVDQWAYFLVSPSWKLLSLLRRAWSANIDERPDMSAIYKILRTECVRCRDGDESGLEHQRRRSTFVFRGSKGNALLTTKQAAATAATAAPVSP